MLVALYIGNHSQDAWTVRLGWWLTRHVQKGDYGRVTHCEVILAGDCSSATIASSSIRDGGVRIKHDVALEPANWLIADVPAWRADEACEWFVEHAGEPYDWRGALATVLPGKAQQGRWFCNESVGAAAGMKSPRCMGPAQFAAMCFSFGEDVTARFFATP